MHCCFWNPAPALNPPPVPAPPHATASAGTKSPLGQVWELGDNFTLPKVLEPEVAPPGPESVGAPLVVHEKASLSGSTREIWRPASSGALKARVDRSQAPRGVPTPSSPRDRVIAFALSPG